MKVNIRVCACVYRKGHGMHIIHSLSRFLKCLVLKAYVLELESPSNDFVNPTRRKHSYCENIWCQRYANSEIRIQVQVYYKQVYYNIMVMFTSVVPHQHKWCANSSPAFSH